MTVLVSVRELSRKLGVPREQLEEIAAHIGDHYHQWLSVNPRTKKERTIRSASKTLKAVQSRIAKRLLATTYGQEVQGGVKGCSPATNAAVHLGQPCVVSVDVRKFFPSVRPRVVYDMFRYEFSFGRDVAALLTRLVTYRGELPQGAATSTAIANALLHLPVDGPVKAAAHGANLEYTRFVDDLSLSGRNPRDLINLIARQLSQRGLAISRKHKLKIMPRSRIQEITGLLVNGSKPSLSRKRRDRVRLAVHAVRHMPEGSARRNAMQSVLGRINYVAQYHSGSARRLKRQLDAPKD